MPLIPLLPIFHRLNRQYFDGLLVKDLKPLVSIRWSDGRLRNTAGFYRHGRQAKGQRVCEIVLSSPVLENLPQSAVESTLCHEMIHAWVDLVLKVSEGHGRNFQARMKAINAAQNDFQISVRHQFPMPIKLPKWLGICPSCGLSSTYKRRTKGIACKHCCDTLYGGRWNPSCVLVFQPLNLEN
ncbi:SprT family zinc-dependent metalloprotease [Prochlorococcus marinus]|uniref:SprT family zinc-dependent metalloprotease n=1 Tax=Prochlorococcus marinus TaxID=1219 RepID=UPI0022B3EE35|nr:SprT family zinc-dependent metalloprotease [Prochlorococcus marinus]